MDFNKIYFLIIYAHTRFFVSVFIRANNFADILCQKHPRFSFHRIPAPFKNKKRSVFYAPLLIGF